MDANKQNKELRIVSLIKKSLFQEISETEKAELDSWVNESDKNRQIFNRIQDGNSLGDDLLSLEYYDTENATRRIFSETGLKYVNHESKPFLAVIRQLKFRKVAAAAVLFFAIAATFLLLIENKKTNNTQANAKIIPGGNKAVLTLSDGSQIILDSATNGLLSNQGNSKVVKLADGQLVYNSSETGIPVKPVYNTLTTPRGGQYQLTLPDGSAVWLNSASSITFPTFFDGNERLVKITGEAYFEIKSLASQMSVGNIPFVVEVANQKITVLGTHFNINAYTDEDAVRTTLVEGSVKVSNASNSVLIKPGEQAFTTNTNQNYNVVRPNLEEVLAWKNGKFIFRNASAKSIMLQLSRWYDIEIIYDNDISGINYSGGLSRKDDIEKLIEILELDGRVKFQLKGRVLKVKRNN